MSDLVTRDVYISSDLAAMEKAAQESYEYMVSLFGDSEVTFLKNVTNHIIRGPGIIIHHITVNSVDKKLRGLSVDNLYIAGDIDKNLWPDPIIVAHIKKNQLTT